MTSQLFTGPGPRSSERRKHGKSVEHLRRRRGRRGQLLNMAKIITCQVQVLDGSDVNIDVNVSHAGRSPSQCVAPRPCLSPHRAVGGKEERNAMEVANNSAPRTEYTMSSYLLLLKRFFDAHIIIICGVAPLPYWLVVTP